VNNSIPKHVAIIMDGNGRWAKQRGLPRIAGHRAGMETVRNVVKLCGEKGIEFLTLFAFSSENWQRPQCEVNDLMELFTSALRREVKKLHKNNVQLRIIGDYSRFSSELCECIDNAQKLTANNTGLKLLIAANYGGRWDITRAARQLASAVAAGELQANDITAELLESHLVCADIPDPDLFIRTSGEQRISNFLIWQLAYTELFFTQTLWPDFDNVILEEALLFYAGRQRRFGCTSEQVEAARLNYV
jgi:undecaprenyl diphosphate synthase